MDVLVIDNASYLGLTTTSTLALAKILAAKLRG